MKIFNKLAVILSEISGIENIYLEQRLQNDLALDSLQLVTLLMMIEDNFHIILDEADMNPFDLITVQNAVNLVEKYIGGDSNEKET